MSRVERSYEKSGGMSYDRENRNGALVRPAEEGEAEEEAEAAAGPEEAEAAVGVPSATTWSRASSPRRVGPPSASAIVPAAVIAEGSPQSSAWPVLAEEEEEEELRWATAPSSGRGAAATERAAMASRQRTEDGGRMGARGGAGAVSVHPSISERRRRGRASMGRGMGRGQQRHGRHGGKRSCAAATCTDADATDRHATEKKCRRAAWGR